MNLRAEGLIQTSFLSEGNACSGLPSLDEYGLHEHLACAGALLDITYCSKIHKPFKAQLERALRNII